MTKLHLVEIVVEGWDTLLESLSLSGIQDDLVWLASGLEWVSWEHLPMVEHALWEGLSSSVGAEISGESEGLVDRQVSLDDEHWGSGDLGLLEDVSSSSVQHSVDTSNGGFWALNLDQVDWLENTWLGGKNGSVEYTTGSWDNLTSSSVDCVSVEGDIMDVEANSAHVFVGENSFTGGPLESSDNGVLDFVKVLNSLGDVEQEIWSSSVWSEAPDLTGFSDIVFVLLGEDLGTSLELITSVDGSSFDIVGETIWHWLSGTVETVVLVWRFGQANLVGLGLDGFTVRDDWIGLLEWDASVVFLQILEANFQVEFSSSGDDVLSGLFEDTLDHRVGLGKTLESFDELWKISWVLGLNGDTHDWGDGELHDTHVVGILEGGDGSSLDEVLIDSDESSDVSGWNILNWLNVTSHHEDGTLDGLLIEILLLSWNVVWSLNTGLHSGGDLSGEDTSESVETSLIGSWHHLGDVHHEWSIWITGLDGNGGLIIVWSLVEHLHSVALSSHWGWQVEGDHLEHSVSGWEPSTHESLHEWFSFEVLLVVGKLDSELLNKSGGLVLLDVHDGVEDHEDWVKNELVESTLAVVGLGVAPLLGLEVEEAISPEVLHEFVDLNSELVGVHLRELLEGESPSVESRSESDVSDRWINHDWSHWSVVVSVGGDDDVDVLNNTLEGLEELLSSELKLKKSTVHLVHEKNWLDTLSDGLTKHSFGLDTHSGDAIDDDESSVSDTKSSSYFRGEVNVTGGIDQVDQETVVFLLLSVDFDGLELAFSLDEVQILLVELEEKRDGSRLDGDTTFLLVLTGVSETGLSGLGSGDDTGLGNEGVGKSGFSVIDVSDDRHVTDVALAIHERTDLIDREVDHF